MIRKPDFAGSFYPGRAADLRRTVEELTDPSREKVEARAVVSPHAGYVYSGPVAGALFSSVKIPAECIVLCPSHQGINPMFGIMSAGSWETPLGRVPVSSDLASSVKALCPLVQEDAAAHRGEHSLEVQLPFLQYFNPEVAMVPLIVSPGAEFPELEALGRALASAIRARGSGVLVVASTDMSHFLSAERAREKDFLAIGRILDLDPRGLYDVVRREGISMCGYQPTVAAMVAAVGLGASRAELVMYLTSGEASGDYSRVVGYAGLRLA